MAEPARFTPEELDRIEDALEGLEGGHAIVDPSPRVQDVLESYRGVLVASREALPLEEVPQGALAAVFAEANAAATAPPQVAAAAAPPEKKPGFFERLRKSFLVPSLALAGSAALVLWISRPQDDAGGMDAPVATASSDRAQPEARQTAKPAEAEKSKAFAGEANEQSLADEEDEDAVPAAEPAPAAPAPDPEPTPDAAKAAPPATAAGNSGLSKLGEVPNDDPKAVEQKKAEDSGPAWDVVERADRARQEGDCAAARSDYMIATEDDDAGVRARAYAGLGLCNALQGDDAGAEDSFERARGIDPGVDSFIRAEREPADEYRAPKKKKRRKSPPKAKSKPKASSKARNAPPAAVDQASPFGG
ncbi:MAG: hypothetical protein AAF721_08860 [Myxococcota bacterium]